MSTFGERKKKRKEFLLANRFGRFLVFEINKKPFLGVGNTIRYGCAWMVIAIKQIERINKDFLGKIVWLSGTMGTLSFCFSFPKKEKLLIFATYLLKKKGKKVWHILMLGYWHNLNFQLQIRFKNYLNHVNFIFSLVLRYCGPISIICLLLIFSVFFSTVL